MLTVGSVDMARRKGSLRKALKRAGNKPLQLKNVTVKVKRIFQIVSGCMCQLVFFARHEGALAERADEIPQRIETAAHVYLNIFVPLCSTSTY